MQDCPFHCITPYYGLAVTVSVLVAIVSVVAGATVSVVIVVVSVSVVEIESVAVVVSPSVLLLPHDVRAKPANINAVKNTFFMIICFILVLCGKGKYVSLNFSYHFVKNTTNNAMLTSFN